MNRMLKNGYVALSLLALAGGGVWVTRARSAGTSASASVTPSAFAWPRGSRYRYDFDWTVASTSTIDMAGAGGGSGATDASAKSSLHGQLVFTSYGKKGDAWVLGVAVAGVREAKLEALGNDLLSAPGAVHDTFDGREAFVEVGDRGDVRHLRFRAGDPPLFRQLLQSVIGESQVVLSGVAQAQSWQAIETVSIGRLETRYAVDAADPFLIHRTPARLLTSTALPHGSGAGLAPVLAGSSDIRLDREGFVRSIAARVDLTIAPLLEHHTVFTMTFLSKDDVEVADDFVLESVAADVVEPGSAPAAPELRKRMDERFATRTSQEQVNQMLSGYAKGLPPARGMLDATAAFLRLHPEACDAIATQFLDPEVSGRSREFMMGLLASAGSPAAQAGMRRGLDVPESRADLGVYGRMVQRLGFVAAPTRESLTYMIALHDSPAVVADADLRRVSGLALGALAAHATGPTQALGDSIHARLVAEPAQIADRQRLIQAKVRSTIQRLARCCPRCCPKGGQSHLRCAIMGLST